MAKKMDLFGEMSKSTSSSAFEGVKPKLSEDGKWIVSPVSYEEYCEAVLRTVMQVYEITLAVFTYATLPEQFPELTAEDRAILRKYKILPDKVGKGYSKVIDKSDAPHDYYICFNPDAKYPSNRWNTLFFLQAAGFGREYPWFGSNVGKAAKDVITTDDVNKLVEVSRKLVPDIFYGHFCRDARSRLATAMRESGGFDYDLDFYLDKPFYYLRVADDVELPAKMIKQLSQDVRLLPGRYYGDQIGSFTITTDRSIKEHSYRPYMWDY